MDEPWDPMQAFDGVTRKASHDIWYQLNTFQMPKWGFVVMRCTYGDDEAWTEVMRRLEVVIQQCFERDDEIDVQVLARHDWSVQEDPALDGASKDAVRRKFRQWADTAGRAEYPSTEPAVQALIKGRIPRFSYCIAIDRESMDSILADPMDVFGGRAMLESDTYVNIIRAEDEWYEAGLPDFDTFDWSQHSGDDTKETPYDEGEEEIEGSRRHDVGWMKFRLIDLHLEFWRLLSATFSEWDTVYVRPNEGIAMED
ncbi:hypothetical protein AMS68_004331 [Peltaster fructicola]|uniref:Uncharacterized protein n=1 Tax=Peltaster fructicola TaxID=286661 RepID=A0A6H0XVR4_9PEZI|nr:hypothetical protein AMS68_004331 [Peltaster fructicola]